MENSDNVYLFGSSQNTLLNFQSHHPGTFMFAKHSYGPFLLIHFSKFILLIFKIRLIFKTDILLLFIVCLGFLKFLYRNMKMKSIAISNVFYYYHYNFFFFFLVKRVIKHPCCLLHASNKF